MALDKSKLHAEFEIDSFNHCRNKRGPKNIFGLPKMGKPRNFGSMTLPSIFSGYVSYLLCSICGARVIEMFETKNKFWGVKMGKPLILGAN